MRAEGEQRSPSSAGARIEVTSCRGPGIWGANWFLIRAAVSAVAFCSACRDGNGGKKCEIRTQESGSVPGCQLTKPTGGGGGWGCVERAKSQQAIHPACLRYVPDNIYEG